MSPIAKTDLLIPVITLVLYMGESPWDAADNLHEILDFSGVTDEWKDYIQNYKIHVLDICHTSDERLMEFPENIACMFLAIKHAGNKEKLSELTKKLPHFQQLDEETYDTIWNYVGNKQMLKMKKASETEKGGIDMRCAIDEIYEDGLAEGEKRGIAGMLDLLKELGCSANDAKLHLKNRLHLSEDTANEYIQKCWNTK